MLRTTRNGKLASSLGALLTGHLRTVCLGSSDSCLTHSTVVRWRSVGFLSWFFFDATWELFRVNPLNPWISNSCFLHFHCLCTCVHMCTWVYGMHTHVFAAYIKLTKPLSLYILDLNTLLGTIKCPCACATGPLHSHCPLSPSKNTPQRAVKMQPETVASKWKVLSSLVWDSRMSSIIMSKYVMSSRHRQTREMFACQCSWTGSLHQGHGNNQRVNPERSGWGRWGKHTRELLGPQRRNRQEWESLRSAN